MKCPICANELTLTEFDIENSWYKIDVYRCTLPDAHFIFTHNNLDGTEVECFDVKHPDYVDEDGYAIVLEVSNYLDYTTKNMRHKTPVRHAVVRQNGWRIFSHSEHIPVGCTPMKLWTILHKANQW